MIRFWEASIFTRFDSVRDDSLDRASQFYELSLVEKIQRAYEVRAQQAAMVRTVIDNSGDNVIVCGDFNDVPASYSYWTVRGNDLRDAYVDAARTPFYTYNRNRFLFHIDHTFYKGALKAVECRRDRVGWSDHYPVVTTFVWDNKENL